MRILQHPVRLISIALVLIGITLLVLNPLLGKNFNVALPLVFLVLGGGFFILVFSLRPRFHWAPLLHVPAALLTAFGIIFLLNVLTGDWQAWAYAWLFLITAIGVGLLLANHDHSLPPVIDIIGWSTTLGGITFFAVFGAIAGGQLIQVMAPILLVAAGISLRWLKLDSILPKRAQPAIDSATGSAPAALIEPLSARELEVLALIDQGLSNQQIADRLSVAPSTVKTHINNLYGKLGVQTRVQAVNRARELNLFNQ
jgi:DNA-binding CsgD family transcriptional regulator